MTKNKRKYWVIKVPEYPSRLEVQKALADYEDNLKQFQNIPAIQSTSVPKMTPSKITNHSFFSKFLP